MSGENRKFKSQIYTGGVPYARFLTANDYSMPYNIAVIGTGYVGLVTGTCFAETGNIVTCVDIDESKVEKLRAGDLTMYEPGLLPLFERNIREKRLSFTTDLEQAVKTASLLFLCLPTPPGGDGAADLSYVLRVAEDIGRILHDNAITDFKVLINKSTVPVGTADKVRAAVNAVSPSLNFEVASNPEFLREGFAVEDFMKPDRVVVGTSNPAVADLMRDLYDPFTRSGNPIFILDERSAEVAKYAANSYLAMRISFMNNLAQYCEKAGADIDDVRLAMGADTRIGKRFLFPGIGYGGSCFPKDVRALIHSAQTEGIDLSILRAAEDVNLQQPVRFVRRMKERFNGELAGKRFAVWGIAFKPNTDDTREAPAFRIIDKLLADGAVVTAYDPEAREGALRYYGDRITLGADMYSTLDGAEALVIATEWSEFRNPDFTVLRDRMAQPIVFDGRNVFDLEKIEKVGFVEYYSIGRRDIVPQA
jgi:UDPglucose 6-dehydrogenase